MTCVPDSVRWAGDVATEEAVMSVLCVFKRRPTSRRPHTSLIDDADPGPANMRARALEQARTCPSTGDATLYPGKRDLGAPLLAGERVELPAKSIKRSAALRDVTCRVLGAWEPGCWDGNLGARWTERKVNMVHCFACAGSKYSQRSIVTLGPAIFSPRAQHVSGFCPLQKCMSP